MPAHVEMGTKTVHLTVDQLSQKRVKGMPEGAYSIKIRQHRTVIRYSSYTGGLYASKTLKQLMDHGEVREMTIKDAPRYAWRGAMLDVSRHFFPVSYLEHLITVMADYKLNKLHLHLTDDQAWRLEIKRYPNLVDSNYYSQQDIQELIRFAADQGVEIIPEIDMPGHMTAAIKAYPELAQSKNDTFYTHVADEVMALFPSAYIHLGMDEVDEKLWSKEEQATFAKRMQAYVTGHGKKLIAWDDVLEAGISKDATIMYWRDWVGGVPEAAAKNGNQLIFSPGTPLYLNRDDTTLYPIYHDLPKTLPPTLLGLQGNLWTERVLTPAQADYKFFPRLIAMAEVAWTSPDQLNWESFKERLKADKVTKLKSSGMSLALRPDMLVDTAIHVRFITEKVQPSIRLKGDSIIRDSAWVQAQIEPDGPLFSRRYDYHKAIHKPVTYHTTWHKAYAAAKAQTLTDGLRGGEKYNDGYWQGFSEDMDVTIDLGDTLSVSYFHANFFEAAGAGIYLPASVAFSVSLDNIHFEKVERATKARYVKMIAKRNQKGGFIFTDEIVVY